MSRFEALRLAAAAVIAAAGKELEGMSSDEIGAWMRNYLPTDPKLRRLVERLRDRNASVQDTPSEDHDLPA